MAIPLREEYGETANKVIMTHDTSISVIVSSNRINDIGPYASHIYHEDPLRWGSIFPWEFPQKAMRDTEERFIREWFPESETDLQGFRFLRQVWYSIAMWNLHHRVPAVADFWIRTTGKAYLSDKTLRPFLFKEDAGVETFFSDDLLETGLYTIKFLQSMSN